MTAADLIRLIGVSHLLQPPLTWLLAGARGLDLRRDVVARSPLAGAVVSNMAFASVALPTALGVLLAMYATEARADGAAHTLGLVISAFWCWRLYRQLFVLRRLWPVQRPLPRALSTGLTLIFVAQGPTLGLLLLR